jgi:hypothetical protein
MCYFMPAIASQSFDADWLSRAFATVGQDRPAYLTYVDIREFQCTVAAI